MNVFQHASDFKVGELALAIEFIGKKNSPTKSRDV